MHAKSISKRNRTFKRLCELTNHRHTALRLLPWVHSIHHLNDSLGECTQCHNLSACLYFSFHSIWFSSLLHLFKTMYVQSGINYRRCVITCDIFYGLQYVNWIGMYFYFCRESEYHLTSTTKRASNSISSISGTPFGRAIERYIQSE